MINNEFIISTYCTGISTGLTAIREWELADSRTYLLNGMEYRNGRIVVPVDGFYYIYCFLGMFEKCHNTSNNVKPRSGAIQLSLFRYNILTREEEQLLSTFRAHKQPNNNYNILFYNSLLSSGLRLSAGDELYIKISNISMLSNPRFNHFGAFLV